MRGGIFVAESQGCNRSCMTPVNLERVPSLFRLAQSSVAPICARSGPPSPSCEQQWYFLLPTHNHGVFGSQGLFQEAGWVNPMFWSSQIFVS
jgi:hypothetical protein